MTMRRPAQIPLDLPANSSLTRDDLVVGAANSLAVDAVDAWPAWPHPVVVIVGPPGSGKTHLAAAWSETSGAVDWTGDLPDETPFAVRVEDIDRAPYDESALFALVNAARLGGGSVLLTSRTPPSALDIKLPDLRSRVRAATVVELQVPDEDLLFGVIVKLAADRQIGIDPKMIAYALARMERSFQAASEFVARVDREALATKEKIGRPLVQRILAEMEVETKSSS
ncbi:hypothetical protein [Aureimonas sp. ME7]|uniref:hypothetical protein n=1 Tax=Aureimonas sp. ME7 TaxID=2744252 RepID=UPI0015F4ECEF|nr:hypothetical protein [Aureimonas sp. ME7]